MAAVDLDATTKQALTAEWDVRGIAVDALTVDARGTIRGMPREREQDAMATLPPLLTRPTSGEPPQFEVGERLGVGGMGVVHAARQRPLRREVAIKLTLPDAPVSDTYQLLREARVTGSLEHPNVVPIHALGRDEAGRPVIVMKRIEGATWEEMLARQQKEGRGAVMRHLDRHLSILLEVTRAVAFAHARGIVHRDVKPANVMIGSFGEVYLVDWGIAVALRDGDDFDLPLAREVREVVGSPAYMAPEMAAGDGKRIDERTDVYLLGATLHEILMGQPPHQGTNAVSMLTRAYASTPPRYDAAVPDELAAICHIAMHREPECRYQTASAFATALEQFREHQHSIKLAEEASAKLERLRDALATAGSAADADRAALYNLFNDCRFGFLNALRIWESNTRAREQLQDALELMIGHELEHGSAGAAQTLLGELPIFQRRLAERVERKRAAEREASKELTNLRRRLDPTAADRPRARLAFAAALVWAAAHGLILYLDRVAGYHVGHLELTGLYGFFAIGTLAAGFLDRRALLSHGASGLKMQLTTMLCCAAAAVVWPVCQAIEVSVADGFVIALLVQTVLWTAAAVAVDQRLIAWVVAMLAGLVLALRWPELSLVWMGVSGTTGAVALGWLRLFTRRAAYAVPLSERWSQRDTERLLSTLRDGR